MIEHALCGSSISWASSCSYATGNRPVYQRIFRGLFKHQIQGFFDTGTGDLPDRQLASKLVPSQRLQADAITCIAVRIQVVVDVSKLLQSDYAFINQLRIFAASSYQPLSQLGLATRALRQYLERRRHHRITWRLCISVRFVVTALAARLRRAAVPGS